MEVVRIDYFKYFNLEEEIIKALVGFHSNPGKDYVSSFFRRGKETCFQVL
jgi:hypothetical protein